MNELVLTTSAQTETLNEGIRSAIVELCVAAHQEEDFRHLFNYVPSGGWHFLAYDEDKLVSHAMVTTRWLQPAGHPLLKTAYIDAVSTLPAYQGHGYGSAVMKKIAQDIEPVYGIACLETDKPGFYERLGWQIWHGPLAGRSENGLIPTPEQHGVMILRFSQTPALDLQTMLTIECQSGRIW